MLQRKSLVLACLAFSALPLLAGCGQGGGDTAAIAAGPPQNPTVPATDLSGVTQNWDKNLPSASRFTVLAAFNNQAVRDNNTGLVWEQAPNGTTAISQASNIDCENKVIAGAMGWRFPSIAELTSVLDRSLPPPYLPAGVFSGIQNGDEFWSSTGQFNNPGIVWYVFLGTVPSPGHVLGVANITTPNLFKRIWCVRGGMKAGA